MAELQFITFACDDPDRVADFWTETLGAERRDLPPSIDPVVVRRPGEGPDLLFKDLRCDSRANLAIHLDLEVADLEAAEQRLTGLGASVRARKSETVDGHTETWTVMEDPAGNGFCLSER